MFQSSPKGTEFTKQHEGFVSRAYKDQGGVVTIGFGFTNLSRVCKAWFQKQYGRPLQMGDKMVMADAVALLNDVLSSETGPVANSLQPGSQEAFDAENDVIYNCGPGAAKWQWALAAKAQQYGVAAAKLLTTAVTASGKPSAGLRVRRQHEALLLERGQYGASAPAFETLDGEALMQVQRDLTTLGYYKGTIDGRKGALTLGAIKNFQRAYGLKVDGVVGAATRSALARAIAARNGQNISLGGGGGVGLGGWLTSGGLHLDNPWVLVGLAVGVVALVYVGFLLWSHRGAILGKRTPA